MTAATRRRKTVATSAVRVGWTVVVRTNTGQRIAFRVDRRRDITVGLNHLVDLAGPAVYVGDPDRWRADGRRHAICLQPTREVTRILPHHHPEARR